MKPSIDRPRSVPRMSIMNVLRGRAGIEVSVTNIIVAIGVSLAVMIGVAASVIYVLPWAQNSQAQSDLSSIQSAETTYFSQKAPVAYGTVAELVAEKALLKSEKRVAITVSANKQAYCAGTVSGAGKYYYITHESTDPTDTVPAAGVIGVTCPTPAQIDAGRIR